MADMIRLRMCGCGLAKYARLADDGTWVFVCENCDQIAPASGDSASTR